MGDSLARRIEGSQSCSGYQGIDLIAPDIVRLSKPFRQAHLRASIVAAFAQNKVEMELA